MALDRDPGKNKIPSTKKESSSTLAVPKIFDLVESSAPIQEIVQQIFADYYSPDHDPERIALGLLALSEKGSDGEAALSYVQTDSGELGEIARQIISLTQNGSEGNMENGIRELLGIKKYTNVRDDIRLSDPNCMPIIFNEAKKNGYTNGDFNEFIMKEKERAGRYIRREGLSPHLTGEVEKEIIGISATFGMHELGYLSLLSPLEILRLRSQKKPNFMLVGSLGKYSAQEFSNFGKKINSASVCHVPDILSDNIEIFQQIENNENLFLTINDALKMGYKSDSMDLVCTNYLLSFLFRPKTRKFDASRTNISKLMEEACRVLKKGASLLMIEHRFGEFTNKDIPFKETVLMLKKTGLKAGFSKIKISQEDYMPVFRKDVSPAEIDKNGFVHSDKLLAPSVEEQVLIRFIK